MKVFLSHGATAPHAKQLAAQLIESGIRPVDAASLLEPGSNWASTLEQELQSADALVFLVEPGADRDSRVQAQWRSAIENSWSGSAKPMIPVVVGNAPLPGFLKDRQTIAVAEDDDWRRVGERVAESLRSAEQQVEAGASPDDAAQMAHHQERLGEIAQDAAKLEPAPEELARQVDLLRTRIHAAGESSRSVAVAELHVDLADVLKRLRKDEDALRELETAAGILVQHRDAARRLARVQTNLGSLLSRLGRKEEARQQLEAARDVYVRLEGPNSFATLVTRTALVTLLRELGDNAALSRETEALKTGIMNSMAGFIKHIPVLGQIFARFLRADGEKRKDEAE